MSIFTFQPIDILFLSLKTYMVKISTTPIHSGHHLVVGTSEDAFILIEKSKLRKVYVQCEFHYS